MMNHISQQKIIENESIEWKSTSLHNKTIILANFSRYLKWKSKKQITNLSSFDEDESLLCCGGGGGIL